jgi:hypothetical protein
MLLAAVIGETGKLLLGSDIELNEHGSCAERLRFSSPFHGSPIGATMSFCLKSLSIVVNTTEMAIDLGNEGELASIPGRESYRLGSDADEARLLCALAEP